MLQLPFRTGFFGGICFFSICGRSPWIYDSLNFKESEIHGDDIAIIITEIYNSPSQELVRLYKYKNYGFSVIREIGQYLKFPHGMILKNLELGV